MDAISRARKLAAQDIRDRLTKDYETDDPGDVEHGSYRRTPKALRWARMVWTDADIDRDIQSTGLIPSEVRDRDAWLLTMASRAAQRRRFAHYDSVMEYAEAKYGRQQVGWCSQCGGPVYRENFRSACIRCYAEVPGEGPEPLPTIQMGPSRVQAPSMAAGVVKRVADE